jgi:multisubunit Na+/H+ antiporter MnhG subunit
MGILTMLCGVLMVGIGLVGLVREQSVLPEIKPNEAALTTIPMGLVILVIGVIIQTKS